MRRHLEHACAHEPGGSHYEMLRAFLDDNTLADANAALDARDYRTHEFGDSVLIAKTANTERARAGRRRGDRVATAA